MRRLTILLAALGALLLVPAAQAFAEGTLTVNVEGIEGGSGEVSSVGGYPAFGGLGEGSPPIECSGPPASGTCETELEEVEEGFNFISLHAVAAPGSELVGWEGGGIGGSGVGCPLEEEPSRCQVVGGGESFEVTAFFAKEGAGGPTNLRTLTIHQSGNGTVSSKPKGVKCAAACSEAQAAFYKNTVVTLTAKPGTGATFTGWSEEAGTCTGTTSPCTVTMSEAQSLTAAFSAGKAIVNPQALTLTKEGSGKGNVKATGLTCEAECTTTTASYFGGVTEPKPKAPALVTLTQAPAFGSTFSGWSGCDEEKEGHCIVSMGSAREVKATYTLLPTKALSVSQSGNGTVSSKPKALKCAAACSSTSGAFPEGAVVTLTAKPGVGATFTGWTSGAGTCTGTTSPCTVTMSEAQSLTAAFSAGKAIVNPQTLTLTKAGSGFGTVKASGLTCEALCTSTSVAYFGGVTEPKPKAAALVTLTAVSAPGSKAVEWSGCTEEKEGACLVSMSAAKAVTATFDELE